MRDPDGAVAFTDTTVVRARAQPLPDNHFLRSPLAHRWRDSGAIVPYALLPDSRTILAERVPFVSLPTEWTDTQLWDAASLTLDLQLHAVEEGFDMKDASAWNVLFHGTRATFCDLMSFEPLVDRRWWPAGQFSRHFILPLLLAQRRGLHAHLAFAAWRDGVPDEVARRQLGWTRYLTRYWPLMAPSRRSGPSEPAAPQLPREALYAYRRNLHAGLRWMLQGVRPQPPRAGFRAGGWHGYTAGRTHYDDASLTRKRETVGRWLGALRPAWVGDLGCNDGEFSRMALDTGARVVSIDGDHDCIDALYRSAARQERWFPVVAQLDDIGTGRGWAGTEFPGLAQRLHGRFDLLLMLAVIHHLAIGASVPLPAVAALAAGWTREHLIVEWLDPADPQVRALCEQRRRDPADFSLAAQRAAFEQAGFRVEEEVKLAPAARVLARLSLQGHA